MARKTLLSLSPRQRAYLATKTVTLLPKYGGVVQLALNQACLLLDVDFDGTGVSEEFLEEVRLYAGVAERTTTPGLDMAVLDGVLCGDTPAGVSETLGVDLLDVADVLARFTRASLERL